MVWDPYERIRREQIRRARAEQALRPQGDLTLEVVQRLQAALQRSQQEQEALVQRYEQQLEAERNRRAVLRQEFQQLQERQLAQFRQQLQEEQAQQRALQQALQQAEERLVRRQESPPATGVIQRFQEELAVARRERDDWADRYDQALAMLAEERDRLERDRLQLEEARAAQQAEARQEAEQQRERVLRNAEQRAYAENRETLLRLLGVADNLERGLQQAGEVDSPIEEGIRLTLRDFHRALEQSGVERVPSEGQPFDPAQHEAISSTPADVEPGRVVTEVLPGYSHRGVLLRPAKVIISA